MSFCVVYILFLFLLHVKIVLVSVISCVMGILHSTPVPLPMVVLYQILKMSCFAQLKIKGSRRRKEGRARRVSQDNKVICITPQSDDNNHGGFFFPSRRILVISSFARAWTKETCSPDSPSCLPGRRLNYNSLRRVNYNTPVIDHLSCPDTFNWPLYGGAITTTATRHKTR